MPYYHIAITKKTGRERFAFAFDMSLEKIVKDIITPLQQQETFMCDRSVISPEDVEDVRISETEEQSRAILKKKMLTRILKRIFTSEESSDINNWIVIRSGKDVTRKLITRFGKTGQPQTSEEAPKSTKEKSKPEISKDELKNYLEEFLKLYRTKVKSRYQAYFNEFPFYGALRAIGVISPYYVYIFFTRDGNPKATTIDVYDENDIPELLRVKDAIYSKREDVCDLLNIKTYIPDLVHSLGEERISGLRSSFVEPNISLAVDESIRNHHTNSVEKEADITWNLKGAHTPSIIPKYSFVYNTMDETTLSDKIKELIDKAEGEEVLVAGWVDSEGMRLMKSLMKRNVKFRIVTHRPTEGGHFTSDTRDVFSKLAREHAESIRILAKLHARLIISDKEALVSTADLTKDSLGAKFEAGISTTDGFTIMKLKEFFEKLWTAGIQLNSPKPKAEEP